MAALTRATKANYTIHDHIEAETTDREDHTFCGIMFPVKCKAVLPIDHVVINTISVRGALGPLTVWVTKDETLNGEISMSKKQWKKVYEKTHPPSFAHYTELDLSANPIMLKPGQVKGVYVHSTRRGDEAIVYDNKEKQKTHDDSFLTILPGRAHLSELPFGTRPIWGWGHAWRDNREFVGQIKYGAVYRLWNPSEHLSFGDKFKGAAKCLFMLQRRVDSPFSKLPDDCIFFIINMCRWDWMNDTSEELRITQKNLRRLRRQQIANEADDMLDEEDGEGAGDTEDNNHLVNENAESAIADSDEDEENDFMEEDEEDSEESEDGDSDADSDADSEQYAWGDHVGARDAFVYNHNETDSSDEEDGDGDQLNVTMNDRHRRAALLRARANILNMFRRSGNAASVPDQM